MMTVVEWYFGAHLCFKWWVLTRCHERSDRNSPLSFSSAFQLSPGVCCTLNSNTVDGFESQGLTWSEPFEIQAFWFGSSISIPNFSLADEQNERNAYQFHILALWIWLKVKPIVLFYPESINKSYQVPLEGPIVCESCPFLCAEYVSMKKDISSWDKTLHIFRPMFLRCLEQLIRTFTISGKHPQNSRQPSDDSEKHVTAVSCSFWQGTVFWSKAVFR